MCCGSKSKSIATKTKKEFPSDYYLYPTQACAMCAEKHISTAYTLALEIGYAAPNRQRIIGELTAAALHLYAENKDLAEMVRDARHLVQRREESKVDWNKIIFAVNDLAEKEIQNA